MVVDDSISQALNRIADGIEENNIVLNRIANHYDILYNQGIQE